MDPDQTPLNDQQTPGAPIKTRQVHQNPIGNPGTRRQLFQQPPVPPSSPSSPYEERKRARIPEDAEEEPTTPIFTRNRPLLRGWTFLVVTVAKRLHVNKEPLHDHSGESPNNSEDEFQESD